MIVDLSIKLCVTVMVFCVVTGGLLLALTLDMCSRYCLERLVVMFSLHGSQMLFFCFSSMYLVFRTAQLLMMLNKMIIGV